jgi:hypothetical protein
MKGNMQVCNLSSSTSRGSGNFSYAVNSVCLNVFEYGGREGRGRGKGGEGEAAGLCRFDVLYGRAHATGVGQCSSSNSGNFSYASHSLFGDSISEHSRKVGCALSWVLRTVMGISELRTHYIAQWCSTQHWTCNTETALRKIQ